MVGLMRIKKKIEVNVLLNVKAKATCKAGSSLNEMAIFLRSPKKGNIKITPITLNKEAEKATNFEIGDNFKLTRRAVDVVPMLAPMTIGIAMSISMVPCVSKTMTNPTTTELDWTMMVMIIP